MVLAFSFTIIEMIIIRENHMKNNESTSQDYFIDGIANLSLTAGAFRFDLVAIMQEHAPSETSGEAPERKQHLKKYAHVVMTPEGYVRMLKSMQDILDKAKEEGVLTTV